MQQPKTILILAGGAQVPVLNDAGAVASRRAAGGEVSFDIYANQQKSPLSPPELLKSLLRVRAEDIRGVIEIGDEVVEIPSQEISRENVEQLLRP